MKRPSARWPVLGAQLAIVGLVLYFIGRTVVGLWPQIRGTHWQPSPFLLIGSVAVGFVCQALLVVGWRLCLRLAGAPISWRGAISSQILGQLGKYVPGKVLTLVGKAYLASRSGVPVSRTTLAMFVEAAAQVATALAVGAAYIVVLLPSERRLLPATIGLIVLCLGLLHPAVLPRFLNWVLRRLGREVVRFSYHTMDAIGVATCYALYWSAVGLALYIMVLGLGLTVSWTTLTASYAMSWAIGFLSFVFPGGLGVREYAHARLLGPAADAGAAMGISLAARGWLLAAELPCALGVWLYELRAAPHRSTGRTDLAEVKHEQDT